MNEIIRSSSCYRDTARILEYLLQQHAVDVAIRFSEALEATYERIAEFPDLGSLWESDKKRPKELRCWPVPGFERFLVFYRRATHGILIERVFHGHQDIDSQI